MDLQYLPRLRDSLTYLYIEHAIVDRKQNAIEYIRENGRVLVPVAALCILMLGPGTSISHAAVKVLQENGCLVVWSGEDGIRFYAQGAAETRKSYHLLRQAELVCDPARRERVVYNMYRMRFNEELPENLSLPQVRGLEGVRVRESYAQAAKKYGIRWEGRRYDLRNWNTSDPVNMALSAANALLNGICHAAIVSGGYSPALGFIHTGRLTSFVYDIADLYKTEITIPVAFQIAGESTTNISKRVRETCRERFRQLRLLERILPDIDRLLEVEEPSEDALGEDPPSVLWEALEAEWL